jgi:hypothetical protein
MQMKSECWHHPFCPHGTTSQPWDGTYEIVDMGFYWILLKKN